MHSLGRCNPKLNIQYWMVDSPQYYIEIIHTKFIVNMYPRMYHVARRWAHIQLLYERLNRHKHSITLFKHIHNPERNIMEIMQWRRSHEPHTQPTSIQAYATRYPLFTFAFKRWFFSRSLSLCINKHIDKFDFVNGNGNAWPISNRSRIENQGDVAHAHRFTCISKSCSIFHTKGKYT